MRLKYNIIFEPVGPIVIGVVVGDDVARYNQIIKLNKVSFDVAKNLCVNRTEDELVDLFLEEYDADRELAKQTVQAVISALFKAEVLAC